MYIHAHNMHPYYLEAECTIWPFCGGESDDKT